uniref:Bifunctional glutamate/proline--tRNA ligase n=1 Tax=Lygus hesperus TaxID=30085 RepID=A0A0K8SGP1_LYGHE
MLGDPELVHVQKSDIIQLQRKGFFICDRQYEKNSIHTGLETPIVLFSIPDGHTKIMPTTIPQAVSKATESKTVAASNTLGAEDISAKILDQGNLVRSLKTQKAAKNVIDEAVGTLLSLKANFKNVTGKDWIPPTNEAPAKTVSPASSGDLSSKIVEQGDKIRSLKTAKAAKNLIDEEVKKLLTLKAEYKTQVGKDWTPTANAPSSTNTAQSGAKKAENISDKIVLQGNKIRDLKTNKSPKNVIDEEVKTLLALKCEYKAETGRDWIPGAVTVQPPTTAKTASDGDDSLSLKITAQGNKIRDLKSSKSPKNVIDAEVKILLALKTEYKTKTGCDWGSAPVQPPSASTNETAESLSLKVAAQGNKVRDLKSSKAPKEVVDVEVKTLLALKAEFKSTTGMDWTPSKTIDEPKNKPAGVSKEAEISAQIAAQGDKVRVMKDSKAAKNLIDEEVKVLLALKNSYKEETGKDWGPPKGTREPKSAGDNKSNKKGKELKKQQNPGNADGKKGGEAGPKKVTRLGLEASKATNLPDWYSQVITKGELIEYYDVSGCYILRPWSFSIWEFIKDWLDQQFKSTGVKNCYFPMFVSRAALEKEKSHIADFSPEVAWVTKSGDSEMAEPIAIRPTSETVMYPAYAKWIQSYRDLPMKLNQWNNVVRWEFKHPQPFLRTREFLWQEGHTAFASSKEAEEEVAVMLGFYEKVYVDLLAIPVVKGRKTEKEKFAGGDYTTTVEAFISASGRAIQGATSHHLGQNFSKMFEIVFEDPETQEKKYVFQNSWGLTTRTIGVMIMVHADDQGLVLPPRVAPTQVVIVPCGVTASLSENEKNKLLGMCRNLNVLFTEAGVRVESDLRDNYSPGWKFNHWELKGVPLRIEIGPKDMANQQVVAVRRDTGIKITLEMSGLAKSVIDLLNSIQASMLQKATNDLHEHMKVCTDWRDFCNQLENKNIIQSPFCGRVGCEDKIKNDSAKTDTECDVQAPSMGAKSLCIPFEPLRPLSPNDKCIHPECNTKPQFITLFGRSY